MGPLKRIKQAAADVKDGVVLSVVLGVAALAVAIVALFVAMWR